MRRHIYDRLEVKGDLTAVFDPREKDGLVKAVEYLRRVQDAVTPRQPTTPSAEAAATPPQTGGELDPATPPQPGGELDPATPPQPGGELDLAPPHKKGRKPKRQHPQIKPRELRMIWLMAVGRVKVGNNRWIVQSFLHYEEIAGKTNEEIWKMFDRDTDRQIEAIARRKASRLFSF